MDIAPITSTLTWSRTYASRGSWTLTHKSSAPSVQVFSNNNLNSNKRPSLLTNSPQTTNSPLGSFPPTLQLPILNWPLRNLKSCPEESQRLVRGLISKVWRMTTRTRQMTLRSGPNSTSNPSRTISHSWPTPTMTTPLSKQKLDRGRGFHRLLTSRLSAFKEARSLSYEEEKHHLSPVSVDILKNPMS